MLSWTGGFKLEKVHKNVRKWATFWGRQSPAKLRTLVRTSAVPCLGRDIRRPYGGEHFCDICRGGQFERPWIWNPSVWRKNRWIFDPKFGPKIWPQFWGHSRLVSNIEPLHAGSVTPFLGSKKNPFLGSKNIRFCWPVWARKRSCNLPSYIFDFRRRQANVQRRSRQRRRPCRATL